MKKFLTTLFLILTFFLFFTPIFSVSATDLNIDCLPSGCSSTGIIPLFSVSADGFWYPGKSITKTLNLKNSDPETREMAIRGTRTSPENILENVMHISIIGGTTTIWSGSVADFYSQDKIGMGIFASGADLDYNFGVFMSPSADDNYQSKETVFDLTLGFWGDPISTPTPTSGTVLGTGVSSPVCTDIAPASAPVLTNAVAGINSVTLFWNEANGPLTYYLIAFGTQPGVSLYGNPNIGGLGTTSYTVTNLSAGQLYYFKVRAGNGCMPGSFSNELSAVPLGTSLATSPPPGFEPGILGETTDKSATESGFNLPDIMGAENQSCQKYIPLLFIIALLLNSLYFYKNPKGNITLPLLVSLTSTIIDGFILQKACCLIPDIFCRYFYIGNLISFILPRLAFRKKHN